MCYTLVVHKHTNTHKHPPHTQNWKQQNMLSFWASVEWHPLIVEEEHMVSISCEDLLFQTGLIKPCSLCVNVWHTIWILLRLNLKHVCCLQLSVQPSQGVQLTCDCIDPYGAILVQDCVPNKESKWSAIQPATTVWVILEESLCRAIHYAPVGFVGISGLDFSYLIHHLFFQNPESVGRLRENGWFVYICHYDVHLSIKNCLDTFVSLALQVRHCFFICIYPEMLVLLRPILPKGQTKKMHLWPIILLLCLCFCFPFPSFFCFWFIL